MAQKVKVQCWAPVWSEKVGGVGWITRRSGWLLELLTELINNPKYLPLPPLSMIFSTAISWQVISTLFAWNIFWWFNDESNASLGSIITIESLIILCRCWHWYWLSEIISKLPSKQDQNQHQLYLDISRKVHIWYICSKHKNFKITTANTSTSTRRF